MASFVLCCLYKSCVHSSWSGNLANDNNLGNPLLQVIQRIGHWLLDSFGTAYIIPGFTPEALLALGLWPGAAQKDFTGFWAERFHVAVPEELVYQLLPGLKALEEQVQARLNAAAGDKKRVDKQAQLGRRMVQVLRMGAVVVVQDALELAERYPNNPIHKYLLEDDTFRCVAVHST